GKGIGKSGMNVDCGDGKGVGGRGVAKSFTVGVDGQLTFKIRQVQKAGIASCPDDDDTVIEVSGRAQFKGILTSVLRRGGTTYDRRAVRIKHIKVIIVGRGTERIRPKKDYWPTWQRHRVVISSSEAVDVSTLSIDRSTSRAAVDKISFPGSRGPVFVVPDVANRGEV